MRHELSTPVPFRGKHVTPSAGLHRGESSRLPYLVSVPGAAEAGSAAWPILFFLHGYDEGPPTSLREALTRHGPLAPTASAAAREGFILVGPQMPARGDLWYRHADHVLEIVRQVQGLRNGDPERTYLTGFSFGGNGVFDLALVQDGVWAALWPVDPTRIPAADIQRPVWLSSGEISRQGKEAFTRRLRLDALRSGSAGARIYEDDGEDHVGTATLAYQDERIYRWLLAQRLPGARTP